MKTNIILTGMPASGKTTIGIELSKVLENYTFIDTDSFIEKTSGMKIIFVNLNMMLLSCFAQAILR